MTEIRTVADMVAELTKLDQSLPVGCLTFNPNHAVVGALAVVVEKRRCLSPEHADDFSGTPYWFELGSPAAIYHEERGGELATVVVITAGP